jgi:hypothetical protein
MDLTSRVAAGAHRMPTLGSEVIEDSFGDDRAGRVASAEKQHVTATLRHDYVRAQHPLVGRSDCEELDAGVQQDEVEAPLPQLVACSGETVSISLLPNSDMEPSDLKLSQAIPCGSVTQYLFDIA